MKISSVENSFIDALKSLKRNRSLSFASIATVAATLFIFGVFLLLQVNLNAGVQGVQSELEVRVTMGKKITSDQQSTLEATLKNMTGVKSVTLETKEEALVNFKKRYGERLSQGLDKSNPLPYTFIIKVNQPEVIADVVKNSQGLPGVEDVSDGKEIVKTVMTITRTIKLTGLGIFLILIAVSFFLIGNTIKLTVFSRRREIGIMKYIGATDWFIRAPFIIEGVLLGVFGAILSDLLLYFLYSVIVSKTGAGNSLQLISAQYVSSTLLFQFLLIGSFIGCLGSVFAVRKFLVV
ncbi:MAG: ABC transporter permease [Clostridiaceae bacterium]|nr:ABC transporter permease [Clostridiaceae bacterium]